MLLVKKKCRACPKTGIGLSLVHAMSSLRWSCHFIIFEMVVAFGAPVWIANDAKENNVSVDYSLHPKKDVILARLTNCI